MCIIMILSRQQIDMEKGLNLRQQQTGTFPTKQDKHDEISNKGLGFSVVWVDKGHSHYLRICGL